MSFFDRKKKSSAASSDSSPDEDDNAEPGTELTTSDDINYSTYVNSFLTNVTADGLNASKDPNSMVFATSATQQVVSMMGEDARSYLQGMELIYTAATAKGLELTAEEQPAGPALLTAVTASQLATGNFSLQVAACAEAFSKL